MWEYGGMSSVHQSASRRAAFRASNRRDPSVGRSSTRSTASSLPASSRVPSSNDNGYHEPVEHRCTLWVRDESSTKDESRDEVLLNMDIFEKGSVHAGDLMAIIALKNDSGVREFHDRNAGGRRDADSLGVAMSRERSGSSSRPTSEGVSGESGHDSDATKGYLFVVKDMSKAQKLRQPNLEVSIPKHVANVFGLKNRSTVLLTTVCGVTYSGLLCDLHTMHSTDSSNRRPRP